MRYLLLLACVGAASLVLAQGRPRVPAHFRNSSVTTDRAFVGDLYVDGGATWAGTVSAPKLEADVLDAGQAWVGVLGNPDGGEVYAPAGLAVDPGSFICLDEPTCNYRIYKSATQLVLNGAGQPVACIDGFAAQGIIEAGTLQPNSVELVGGATSATVRVASGTGATPDARLRLEAAGPDGLVDVVRDAGIAMRTARLVPRALADIPACTSDLSGAQIAVAWPGGLSDGGLQVRSQECDGEHWIADRYLLDVGASQKAGSALFWVNNPKVPGRIEDTSIFVQRPGVGAAPYEVRIRQGSRLLCIGGGLCNDIAGTFVTMTCAQWLTYANLDGGVAQRLVAETDAGGGCAQTPELGGNVNVDRFGYPDTLWSPPE